VFFVAPRNTGESRTSQPRAVRNAANWSKRTVQVYVSSDGCSHPRIELRPQNDEETRPLVTFPARTSAKPHVSSTNQGPRTARTSAFTIACSPGENATVGSESAHPVPLSGRRKKESRSVSPYHRPRLRCPSERRRRLLRSVAVLPQGRARRPDDLSKVKRAFPRHSVRVNNPARVIKRQWPRAGSKRSFGAIRISACTEVMNHVLDGAVLPYVTSRPRSPKAERRGGRFHRDGKMWSKGASTDRNRSPAFPSKVCQGHIPQILPVSITTRREEA